MNSRTRIRSPKAALGSELDAAPVPKTCTDCQPTLVYSEPGVYDTLPDYPQWQTGSLSLDASKIYFDVCDFSYGQCFIKSVSKSGGTATTFGGGNVDASGVTLANDRRTIYTAAHCSSEQNDVCDLVAIPKDGEPMSVLTESSVGLAYLVEDRKALYWYGADANGQTFGVQKIRKNGSRQEVLVSTATDSDLAHAYTNVRVAEFGDEIYYGYNGDYVEALGRPLTIRIKKVKKGGGAPVSVYERDLS